MSSIKKFKISRIWIIYPGFKDKIQKGQILNYLDHLNLMRSGIWQFTALPFSLSLYLFDDIREYDIFPNGTSLHHVLETP